jgi:outer membrane protein W
MTRVEQLGDPVATYGVYADYAVSNNFMLGATLDYWSKSNASLSDTIVDARDLIAAVEGKFVFTDVRSPFRPYLVAAAGIHRFDITETNQAANFVGGKLEDKYRGVNGKLGLDYGAGALLQLNRSIDILGELRVRDILETGIDLGQTSFTAGLNFLM